MTTSLLWLALGAAVLLGYRSARQAGIADERAREDLEAWGCACPDDVPADCVLGVAATSEFPEEDVRDCGVACP